ncbi:unnamed protein product [Symbiodinium natans]|uniref:Uncharacterized protein n=1 Tax=Symbiodinium natans TaxID=878477 RepID=A0A812MTS1_9DINO|nr:unnamed protein product [Symbiodinium natans]
MPQYARSLCQLETEMVEKAKPLLSTEISRSAETCHVKSPYVQAVQQDLQEYEVQLACRLLSDSQSEAQPGSKICMPVTSSIGTHPRRQISEEHQRQASRETLSAVLHDVRRVPWALLFGACLRILLAEG